MFAGSAVKDPQLRHCFKENGVCQPHWLVAAWAANGRVTPGHSTPNVGMRLAKASSGLVGNRQGMGVMSPTGYARAMRLPEMYRRNPDAHQNGNSGCQRYAAQLVHNLPPASQTMAGICGRMV